MEQIDPAKWTKAKENLKAIEGWFAFYILPGPIGKKDRIRSQYVQLLDTKQPAEMDSLKGLAIQLITEGNVLQALKVSVTGLILVTVGGGAYFVFDTWKKHGDTLQSRLVEGVMGESERLDPQIAIYQDRLQSIAAQTQADMAMLFAYEGGGAVRTYITSYSNSRVVNIDGLALDGWGRESTGVGFYNAQLQQHRNGECFYEDFDTAQEAGHEEFAFYLNRLGIRAKLSCPIGSRGYVALGYRRAIDHQEFEEILAKAAMGFLDEEG